MQKRVEEEEGGYIEIFENEPDKKDEAEDGECDDWVPEPGRIAL